jgi:hypothetical protein
MFGTNMWTPPLIWLKLRMGGGETYVLIWS